MSLKNRLHLNVSYDGEIVHSCEGSQVERMMERSSYFDSLVHRWTNKEDEEIIHHDIPPLPSISKYAFQIVLLVLRVGIFDSSMLEVPSKGSPIVHLDVQVLEVSFYLGSESYILPKYCKAVDSKRRLHAAQFFANETN